MPSLGFVCRELQSELVARSFVVTPGGPSTHPQLVVGCPIRDRAWIVEDWLTHIAGATHNAGLFDQVSVVLVGDPRVDTSTFRAATSAAARLCTTLDSVATREPAGPYVRTWTLERFKHMSALRNMLLAKVRVHAPAYFWSVDSDVLVSADALSSAIDASSTFDAVGSRCYMTQDGRDYPSRAVRSNDGTLVRDDDDRVSTADVIMAVKLMKPRAYAVNYAAHPLGEDVAWSLAAQRAGCALGWDGRTVSKHVMSEGALGRVDERCGY